jgi:hypothetical protein
MKPRREDEPEFNPPAEILARLMVFVSVGTLTAGILLTLAGALTRDLRLLALGVATLAISGLTREWLRRHGGFDREPGAFPSFAAGGSPLNPQHVSELMKLMREWEIWESKRGSPEFDPWALQAVRHDIRVLVESDPALERLLGV